MMDLTSNIGPEQSAPASPAPETTDTDLGTLAELPPVRALLEGNPGAIYAPEGINTPLTQTIGQNFKKMGELGLALYRSPNKVMVMFNPNVVDPDDLRAADKAGKLDTVAKPLAAFEGEQAPVAGSAAPAAPSPVGAPVAPINEGLTPRAQSKLAGERLSALKDNPAPSKRPVPGAGRILNGLIERAV